MTLGGWSPSPVLAPSSLSSVRALVPDPGGFKSGRHFAAWLGLTPKPHSSGGKERLGRISKMGNPALRSLLVVGATAVLRHARDNPNASRWIDRSSGAAALKVVAVALADKIGAHHLGVARQGRQYQDKGARQPVWRPLESICPPIDQRGKLTETGAKPDDIPGGRNPDARQAVMANALTARFFD